MDAIETSIQAALDEFDKHEGVKYRTQRVLEKRLSGGEVAVIVVTFVFSGVFGGILKEIGKDVWEATKRLHTRMGKQKCAETDYRLELTIRERFGRHSVEFLYSVPSTDELDSLDRFLAEVQATLLELQGSNTHSLAGRKIQKNRRFVFDGKKLMEEWK